MNVGDRVERTVAEQNLLSVPPGALGTIRNLSLTIDQLHIEWDDGLGTGSYKINSNKVSLWRPEPDTDDWANEFELW